jgi:hypothetical protein
VAEADADSSPIAAELQALVELAGGWLRAVLPDDEMATGAPECAKCPLCRAVRALRDDSPHVKAAVAATVDGAVTALNAIVELVREHAAAHPGAEADLHDADLHDADLHDADLHDVDLHDADLHDADQHDGDDEHGGHDGEQLGGAPGVDTAGRS